MPKLARVAATPALVYLSDTHLEPLHQCDPQELFVFTNREDVSGTITIKPNGKPLVHEGIKIEFVGQIGAFSFVPTSNPHARVLPFACCRAFL